MNDPSVVRGALVWMDIERDLSRTSGGVLEAGKRNGRSDYYISSNKRSPSRGEEEQLGKRGKQQTNGMEESGEPLRHSLWLVRMRPRRAVAGAFIGGACHDEISTMEITTARPGSSWVTLAVIMRA